LSAFTPVARRTMPRSGPGVLAKDLAIVSAERLRDFATASADGFAGTLTTEVSRSSCFLKRTPPLPSGSVSIGLKPTETAFSTPCSMSEMISSIRWDVPRAASFSRPRSFVPSTRRFSHEPIGVDWFVAEQGNRVLLEVRELPARRFNDVAHAVLGFVGQHEL
jgi:hypothetical protein